MRVEIQSSGNPEPKKPVPTNVPQNSPVVKEALKIVHSTIVKELKLFVTCNCLNCRSQAKKYINFAYGGKATEENYASTLSHFENIIWNNKKNKNEA